MIFIRIDSFMANCSEGWCDAMTMRLLKQRAAVMSKQWCVDMDKVEVVVVRLEA